MKVSRNRYRTYISVQALVVVGVLLSFKVIEDRQIAALLAGSFFVLSAIGVLVNEWRQRDFQKRPSFWLTLAFLVGFALPILGLRIFNWGTPFSELSFLGISGAKLHQASNIAFLMMLVGFFADSFLENRRLLKEKSPSV